MNRRPERPGVAEATWSRSVRSEKWNGRGCPLQPLPSDYDGERDWMARELIAIRAQMVSSRQILCGVKTVRKIEGRVATFCPARIVPPVLTPVRRGAPPATRPSPPA